MRAILIGVDRGLEGGCAYQLGNTSYIPVLFTLELVFCRGQAGDGVQCTRLPSVPAQPRGQVQQLGGRGRAEGQP